MPTAAPALPADDTTLIGHMTPQPTTGPRVHVLYMQEETTEGNDWLQHHGTAECDVNGRKCWRSGRGGTAATSQLSKGFYFYFFTLFDQPTLNFTSECFRFGSLCSPLQERLCILSKAAYLH